MDLSRKKELLVDGILSISKHTDEDAVVRKAILDQVTAVIEAEKGAIDQEVADRIAALSGE